MTTASWRWNGRVMLWRHAAWADKVYHGAVVWACTEIHVRNPVWRARIPTPERYIDNVWQRLKDEVDDG